MGNIGIPELVIILIIALVAFGPQKLPELSRTVGKALAEFRRRSNELRSAFEEEMRELERHTREIEAEGKELIEPPAEPAILADSTAGYGIIDPQLDAPPDVIPPAPACDEPPLGEKPADGDPHRA